MWQKLQGMPDLPMKLGLLALYVIGAVYVGTQQEVWHTMAESVAMPLLDTRQGKDLMGNFYLVHKAWRAKKLTLKQAAAACGMPVGTFYSKAVKFENTT